MLQHVIRNKLKPAPGTETKIKCVKGCLLRCKKPSLDDAMSLKYISKGSYVQLSVLRASVQVLATILVSGAYETVLFGT